ncbi:unnamed protein product [Protopolystoma xenopodis]|uniref:Uncharacterized protein n=1 Tax=Protopolystoma xenopodis TaxID=117903 RepID=A0A448WI06_9PLAT|nr:unnamed protein product [Protopolystoma xenopodis]
MCSSFFLAPSPNSAIAICTRAWLHCSLVNEAEAELVTDHRKCRRQFECCLWQRNGLVWQLAHPFTLHTFRLNNRSETLKGRLLTSLIVPKRTLTIGWVNSSDSRSDHSGKLRMQCKNNEYHAMLKVGRSV